MHERYLFIADTMSVVYAFVFPRRFWIAFCVVGASLAGYSSFLFSKTPVPLPVAATMMGFASVVVVADLLKHHYPRAFQAQRDDAVSSYGESPVGIERSTTSREQARC